MRIRMVKLAAGPSGVWPPGMEVVIDDDVGRAMCESGAAVPVKGPAREKAVVVPDEHAASGDTPPLDPPLEGGEVVAVGAEIDEDQRPRRRARKPGRGKAAPAS